jgi:TM2 domain-containing membrane protein YozV
MLKVLRFTEYLYVVVAILSIVKIANIYLNNTGEDITIFVLFGLVSIVMLLFRINYRNKFDNRKNNS